MFLKGLGGTPGATRTRDTRFRKPLLYPLSYRGVLTFYKTNIYKKIHWLLATILEPVPYFIKVETVYSA